MKNLSQTIKKLRETAGLSATELANRSGLSLAFISKLEGGEYNALSLKSCKNLADGLGLTLKDFLESTGYLEERSKTPTFELISKALRSDGYTDNQALEIVRYAKFLKSKANSNN